MIEIRVEVEEEAMEVMVKKMMEEKRWKVTRQRRRQRQIAMETK